MTAMLSVVVPVHNELQTVEASIRRVIDTEFGMPVEIIAVDDGSTDGSGLVLEALRAEGVLAAVERSASRQGKAAAVRLGFARSHGSVVVVQDGDLEYDPADLLPMVDLVVNGTADAVCGTRFSSGARTVHFFWRALANRLITLASNARSNLNLSDVNCGYKVMRGDLARSLAIAGQGFTVEVAIIAELARRRARIWELPVTYAGRLDHEGRKTRWYHALQQILWILTHRPRPDGDVQ